MRFTRSRTITLGVCLLVALAASTLASAQTPAWQSYSAKFLCGATTTTPAPRPPGVYKTIVNIHNPHYLRDPTGLPVPLVFLKKIVLALPQGEQPLPPSCKLQEFLGDDEALFVDCGAIKGQLALSGLPATGAIEGFVVLEVPPQPTQDDMAPPLDVTVVYAGRPSGGVLNTLDVERVSPTPIIGIPPLDPCAPD